MTTEEPQRFFFVHLQKTAGTALYQRLRDHFGTRAVYPAPEDQGKPEAVLDVDFLKDRFSAHRSEIRVITGHFPLCAAEALDVPFSTFTVLRDPVERTLSFLRHQRETDERFRDTPLHEIYADPDLRALVDNHMVKMLSLTSTEMTSGALTTVRFGTEHLERARTNLAERIDVVGLQEHFDAFCEALVRRFGWDLGKPRFANRTTPSAVSESFRHQIADDNRMDLELYRFAVGLYEQRCVAEPEAERPRT